MSIRVLLVDNEPVARAGVQSVLAGSGVEVVGEATSVHEAMLLANELRPDVLLLDPRLGDEDGLKLLNDLRTLGQGPPTLIFTSAMNAILKARASALRAVGYLLKTIPPDVLVANIERAAAGESCWTSHERRRLNGSFPPGPHDEKLRAPLTRREREVLHQLSFGLSNKDIAAALDISYETVKEHVQHILKKLDAGDRTQAAVWAVRHELV